MNEMSIVVNGVELKACPFCGSIPKFEGYWAIEKDLTRISCENFKGCAFYPTILACRSDAIEWWNKRSE